MNRILQGASMLIVIAGLSSVSLACGGACGGDSEHSSHDAGGYAVQTKAETKGEKVEAVKDPVCGMYIIDIKKASSEEYKGEVYYFCSEYCKKKFKKDPASYTVAEPHQHDEGEGHKH